jgi:hypothetical protein
VQCWPWNRFVSTKFHDVPVMRQASVRLSQSEWTIKMPRPPPDRQRLPSEIDRDFGDSPENRIEGI